VSYGIDKATETVWHVVGVGSHDWWCFDNQEDALREVAHDDRLVVVKGAAELKIADFGPYWEVRRPEYPL